MLTQIISSEDRQRYTNYYLDLLKRRLDWAINYVSENRQPVAIRDDMQIWLGILRACRHSKLYMLAITLICSLHTWPLHWGYWEDWEQELNLAINASQMPNQKAELLTHLARLMFLTGRREEAFNFGSQVFSVECSNLTIVSRTKAAIIVAPILFDYQRAQEGRDLLNAIEQDIVQREDHNQLTAQVILARDYFTVYKARRLRYEGRTDQAFALLNEMIGRIKSMPGFDHDLLADGYSARSVLYWLWGKTSLAIEDLNRAIELVSLAGYDFAESTFHDNLSLYYWTICELKKAEAILLESIRLSEQLHVYYRLAYNVGNLALVFLWQGRIQDAFVMSERHISLAKSYNSLAENMRAKDNYGIIKFYTGDYQTSQIILEENLPIYEGQMVKGDLIIQLVNLSRCYRGLGKLDEATSAAEKALNHAEQQSYPAPKIISLRCLAEVRTPEQSNPLLQQALSLARQCHRLLDEAACLLSLAGTEADENEQARLWQEGSQILNQIGASAWLEGCFPKHPPKIPLAF